MQKLLKNQTHNLIIENRASSILYHFLTSINTNKLWLLPANICPIVPCTFALAHQHFEFVDIEEEFFCLDLKYITNQLITKEKDIAGFLFNYTYGCELFDFYGNKFKALKADFKDIIIIEDRCLCPPSLPNFLSQTLKNNCFSDLVLYSTGDRKYIDLGIGGIGFIQKDIFHKKKQSSLFKANDYQNLELWWKAALAQGQVTNYPYHLGWKWLDRRSFQKKEALYLKEVEENRLKIVDYKHEINQIYEKNLSKKIQLPKTYQNWRFNILVDDKEKLLTQLFEQGLFASSHYHSSNILFNCNQIFKHSNNLYKKIINLFNDPHYTPQMAYQTVELIKQFQPSK